MRVTASWRFVIVVLGACSPRWSGVPQPTDAVTVERLSPPSAEPALPEPAVPDVTRAVAAGGRHTCAALGRWVNCWGANDRGQLGAAGSFGQGSFRFDRQVVAIASGTAHSCALTEVGDVHCWGNNRDGQLGVGDTAEHAVSDDEPPARALLPEPARAVAAGARHSCAVLTSGKVLCWGANDAWQSGAPMRGRLGATAREMTSLLPVLSHPPGALAIAAHGDHTCALLGDGGVRCWGRGVSGAGGGRPAKIGGSATAIAVGSEHACAILGDGSVRCWGDNRFGQLGAGDSVARSAVSQPPPAVPVGGKAVAIAAGGRHTCVLRDDHRVRCWGANDVGQLGHDNRRNAGATRASLLGLADTELGELAFGITTGAAHTCAVLKPSPGRTPELAFTCWGQNDDGRLGHDDRRSVGISPGDMRSRRARIAVGDVQPARLVAP